MSNPDQDKYLRQIQLMLEVHLKSGCASVCSISIIFALFLAALPDLEDERWEDVHRVTRNWHIIVSGDTDTPSWQRKRAKIKEAAWRLYNGVLKQLKEADNGAC